MNEPTTPPAPIPDNHASHWEKWINRRGRKRVRPLWAEAPHIQFTPISPIGKPVEAAFRLRKDAVRWLELTRQCDWDRLRKRGWFIGRFKGGKLDGFSQSKPRAKARKVIEEWVTIQPKLPTNELTT